MSILFVSDIHISHKTPKVAYEFIRFLKNFAINANALYILGDLFEIWIDGNNLDPFYYKIALEIRKLQENNVTCYFIKGNRDFLLNKYYVNFCRMIQLSDQHVVLYNKKKIVILHGDILCTHDRNYYFFRQIIRQKWIRVLFPFIPKKIKFWIINKIRTISLKKNNKKNNFININQKKILKIMKDTNSSIMIHGHVHDLGIYSLNNKYKRFVLDQWKNSGNFLQIDNSKISVIKFPFNN